MPSFYKRPLQWVKGVPIDRAVGDQKTVSIDELKGVSPGEKMRVSIDQLSGVFLYKLANEEKRNL